MPNIAEVLSARERKVAQLVSVGLSNKQIAQRLNLSEGTVKVHLHQILQKMGIKNRTALAVIILGYERYRAQDRIDGEARHNDDGDEAPGVRKNYHRSRSRHQPTPR
jgi:DNA-binding CsgD family transcriptional regulator